MKKLLCVLAVSLTFSGAVLANNCGMPAISGCSGFWDNYQSTSYKPNIARCAVTSQGNSPACTAMFACIRERAASGEFCNSATNAVPMMQKGTPKMHTK